MMTLRKVMIERNIVLCISILDGLVNLRHEFGLCHRTLAVILAFFTNSKLRLQKVHEKPSKCSASPAVNLGRWLDGAVSVGKTVNATVDPLERTGHTQTQRRSYSGFQLPDNP